MQRSRSPLTLRYDREERRRERSFSMSSLSSCSFSNDHDRSNVVGRGGHKSDKYKQHSRGNNKHHEHARKHKGDYQSGNEKERSSNSSRDKPKSRTQHEENYLSFEPNSNVFNSIDESVDPSVCNFRDTSHISDMTAEPRRNANDDRLERLEKMVEVLVKNKQKSNASVSLDSAGYIGDLNPKNPFFTTSMWLNKITQECLDQNFDDKSCIRYMEQKMDGIIKAWYKTLSNYDFTWSELKMLITRTFPDNTDFATTLHLLVDRIKKPDESITQYYFSKMYLLEACKISGIHAVSCLIDGLNDGYFQQEAKAHNFLTPESLYSNFLSKITNYGPEIEAIQNSQEESEFAEVLVMNQFERKSEPLVNKKCFTCGKFGHISENCRHAPKCYNCKRRGHIAAKCPEGE